ncbi:MAG: O-methyltransferase [Acidimicrobiales bacterium]
MESTWTRVDEFFEALTHEDDALRHARAASADAGLPDIQVSATQGRLLALLAGAAGATRILEVGTLGGYSTIWLARALAPGGFLVTLELDPAHAAVASANLAYAGLDSVTSVMVGDARDSLRALVDESAGPFDFVFIDADKEGNPLYVDLAIAMSRPGTIIVVDNVVRGGAVADPTRTDPRVRATRELVTSLAHDARVAATAIQTVGVKGYDGFALLRVLG